MGNDARHGMAWRKHATANDGVSVGCFCGWASGACANLPTAIEVYRTHLQSAALGSKPPNTVEESLASIARSIANPVIHQPKRYEAADEYHTTWEAFAAAVARRVADGWEPIYIRDTHDGSEWYALLRRETS